MRVPTTDAFNQFLLDNGQSYPYSRLQATRNSFFCKWIMTKGHGNTGVTEYFPVLANTYPNILLLDMIMSGRAKPFPKELSQVMDHMHWWGKKQSLEWYESVVVLMDDALNRNGEIERKELVSILISPMVLEKINVYFASDSIAEHLLMLEWMKWFTMTYKKGDNTPFRTIAEKSISTIHWAIAQVNYHNSD
jgi:hypothetical protein